MRVVIVGAQGYLGSALCSALQGRGVEVIAASSRDDSGIDPASGLLRPAFHVPPGTNALIYLAQSPYYREVPRRAAHLMTVNLVSAVDAARLAMEAGVARFFYASTGNVYAPGFEPLSEDAPLNSSAWYPMSKIFAEQALQLFRPALEVCALRIFGIYGPQQRDKLVPNIALRLLAAEPIVLQPRRDGVADDGGLRVSLCHVDDACSIFGSLIEHSGSLPPVLNLAGPVAVSLRELATGLARRLGVAAHFQRGTAPRDTDLVSDNSRLSKYWSMPFKSLDAGLDETVAALHADQSAAR